MTVDLERIVECAEETNQGMEMKKAAEEAN